MANQKVDFDNYADEYELLVASQLGFFEKESDYFARYKAEFARNKFPKDVQVKKVMDFGCGVGQGIPWLQQAFPDAKVFGADISERSLEIAAKRNPESVFWKLDELPDGLPTFDLVFSAGVFHHIHPSERTSAMTRVRSMLAENGHLFIFEHNPYNPVTQSMVNNCPFDDDAILLKPREWDRLFSDAGLSKTGVTYTLFFPSFLKFFRPIERLLGWLPLGGQYCAMAKKAPPLVAQRTNT